MVQSEQEGQAYIFLEVDPSHSRDTAISLSADHAVMYCAAVWGPWDVMLRVREKTPGALMTFVSSIQTKFETVRRTETYYIRPDQIVKHVPWPEAPRWAFVLLKTRAKRTSEVLDFIEQLPQEPAEYAQVVDASGTLGAYDIAMTVRYFNDTQLKNLVMNRIQKRRGVIGTYTIPSIEEMVFHQGRVVG